MKEIIKFNGKSYTAKWLNIEDFGERLIAEEPLEGVLMPDGASYASEEARNIDEMIFFYVGKGILKSSDSVIEKIVSESISA